MREHAVCYDGETDTSRIIFRDPDDEYQTWYTLTEVLPMKGTDSTRKLVNALNAEQREIARNHVTRG